MAGYGRLLTDAQWEKIRPLLPKRPKQPQGGRPPADSRKVLEGILWILRYDRSLTIYRGFFHIACFMIVLRRVLQ
jgi:hypothetical protein